MPPQTQRERNAPLVLIVDDNPRNLQVLGPTLREQRYDLTAATDGETALRIAHEAEPDLILLDIMMPGMDGYTVCERLKASPTTAEIPVIFLTARTDTDSLVKGFELGAVDYVTKPFQRQELLSRVSTHLELREARRRLVEKNAKL
ncbi:response regulator, partial [Planctomycetota bacterium]